MTLLAHWPLIADADDQSSNSYDLVGVGGPSYGSSHRGGALITDGATQYASGGSTEATALAGLTSGTLMCWFKTSSTTGQCLFSLSDKDSPASWVGLRVGGVTATYNNEAISFIVQDNGGGVELRMHYLNFETYLLDGRWHHVAVIIDGAANKMVIDGVDVTDAVTFASGSAASAYFTNITAADTVAVGVRQIDAGSPADLFAGSICDVRLYDDAKTVAEVRELMFDHLNGVGPLFGESDTGDYTLAGSITTTVVQTPTTGTATENDLETWGYRNHVRVDHLSGVTYLAHSISPENEDSDAEHVIGWRSFDAGATWSGPDTLIAAQSDFATDAAGQTDSYAVIPTTTLVHNGRLYLIADYSHWPTVGTRHSLALLAREWGKDGAVGSPFRVTPQSYTPQAGHDEIEYDAELGPALLEHAIVYGHWQGSNDARVAWRGQYFYSGQHYTEFGVVPFDGNRFLARFMRRTDAATTDAYMQWSFDGGKSWYPTDPAQSVIPNYPSSIDAIALADNRIVLGFNPEVSGFGREPLAIAISDAGGVNFDDVYAVRQGDSGGPTFSGFAKTQGYQYSGMVQVGNYLHIGYSIDKETIAFSRVLIPGLTDNNNDITAYTDAAVKRALAGHPQSLQRELISHG